MMSTAGPPGTGKEQLHPSVVSKPLTKGVPLSWEQEQIWLHAMQFPELPLYTETFIVLYRGDLNVVAFQWAIQKLCQRHEILRSVIEEHDGFPSSVVNKEPTPGSVEFFDLADEAEDVREERFRALIARVSSESFVLDRGPLLRVSAVRYASEDTRIVLTLHHLLFDGASLRQILLPELITLYEDYITQASRLPVPKMQYADYVDWQRDHAAKKRDAAMNYWRAKLANFSPLSLPEDRPHTPRASRLGAAHYFELDETLSRAVLETTRQHKTTAFSFLLASLIALLARYTEAQDISLGTIYGGRPSMELESVMGCFLNILFIRTDLEGDPTFASLLARVREVVLEAMENSAAPFHEIVRQILPKNSGVAAGGLPVQVVFSFQPPSRKLPPAWDLDVFDVFNGCAKFDLHIEIEQRHGVFRGRLMYSKELFDQATIECLTQHWFRLLQAATQKPETSIWELPILSSEQQDWLLRAVNPVPAPVPRFCAHDLFAQNADEAPDSIAIRHQGQSLTYTQLERWSANIANRLLRHGIGSGCVVAIMIERSPAMVAGLLGILRAGSAYMPLDPTYPAARLEHMMRASGAAVLLAPGELITKLTVPHPPVLDIADCHQDLTDQPMLPLPIVDVSAPAYILFTSGSTGLPKGVEIPHSALTNLLWSMAEKPGIRPEDRLMAATSISFDIAALELFLPLIAGASVELATTQEAADPVLLATRLAESGATMMQATPASWRMLVDSGWKPVRPLKILCGGEALSPGLAEQLAQRSNAVWNMYGPTETTIWSACCQLRPDGVVVPLGEPVKNTGLYVLDAHQKLAPIGIPGELYIGGAGLARGYCGQPELTEERFPTISLAGERPIRLYRTGDRVKRMRDGSLQFLGRTDRQIKLHGFRIELDEIEHVLNSLPGVRAGVVVVAEHPSRGPLLAAYVVPEANVSLQVEKLRTALVMQLPGFMQPSTLRILDEMPLTPNGKLDRSRLPSIENDEKRATFDPPLSGIEQTMASIWCDVLNLKALERHDNFFDLGGRSLEALRCISLTNRALDATIRFTTFIQGPTIAQLARIIQEGSAPRVQLIKQGSSASKQLIWIGAGPWLTHFADHLKDDITLYAVSPDLEKLTNRSIQTMAAQMLSDIRELERGGPYLLAGFCLRSLLALELARRLAEEGSEIGLLILGDVYAPGRKPRLSMKQRIIRRIHREYWNLRNVFRRPSGQRLREMRRLISSWRHMQDVNLEDPDDTPDELLQELYIAERHYRPVSFPGRVFFFESSEHRMIGRSTFRTWEGIISKAEVFRYPGIHENFLINFYTGMFAKKIEDAIDRTLANND